MHEAPVPAKPETLRRLTLLIAVASSRDVAALHPFGLLLRAAQTLRRHTLLDCCCGQHRRCGVTPFWTAVASSTDVGLLLRAAQTLRRRTFWTAAASSTDVAASHPFDCCCEQQRCCGVTSFWIAVASSTDVAASHPLDCCCLQQRHCSTATAEWSYAVPVPVVEDIAAAHAVSYAALAPVGEYMAPAPAIAASKGYTFRRATGRCEHGLSPEFHREGVHWVFGRLVRLPRTACTTSPRRS